MSTKKKKSFDEWFDETYEGGNNSSDEKEKETSLPDIAPPAQGGTNVFSGKKTNPIGSVDIAPGANGLEQLLNQQKAAKQENQKGFFNKGNAFSDGWKLGDGIKTRAATAADAIMSAAEGAGGLVEGVTDWLAYGVAQAGEKINPDAEWHKMLKEGAMQNTLGDASGVRDLTNIDDYSLLGNRTRGVLQGVGQVVTQIAAGQLGTPVASYILTYLSSMGSGMGEAYLDGATDQEAAIYGTISGAVNLLSEFMFAGLGKAAKAAGIGEGLGIEDAIAKNLTDKIAKPLLRYGIQYAIKSGGEGLEEVVAGGAEAIAKKLIYEDEKTLRELLKDEQLLDQFVMGAFVSGVAQGGDLVSSVQSGTDMITGESIEDIKNAQNVVNTLADEQIAAAEKDGKKLTAKERADIKKDIEQALERGELNTEDIERIVGGEDYTKYKAELDRQEKIQNEKREILKTPVNKFTVEQQERLAELRAMKTDKEMVDSLKASLDERIAKATSSGRLAESYENRARRGQAFKADLSKYKGKALETVKKAVESGILNDTRRTHEMVDLAAKIAEDKGIDFDFTNNERLAKSIYGINGKQINGYITDSGIVLNANSAKALNKVVGHEITHAFEGNAELYAELKKAVTEYAKISGEYDARLNALKETYKNVKDADPERELVADLVGDYIFADEKFVRSLHAGNRNVFQKVFDEIKYMCKIATAGSEQAKQLEKAKRMFEKVYREGKAETKGEQFSLVGITEDGIEVYETSEEIMALSWKERKAKYLDVMQNEYRGRTAKFMRNGHAYYAEFDQNSIRKPIYGDKRSSIDGKKALIKAGADGDVFTLVENSRYTGSRENIKDHTDADYFDYFVKTVQIDGQVFDLVADVEKKYGGDGGYVYTLALRDSAKKIKAPPTRGSNPVYSVGNALSNDIVPQNPEMSSGLAKKSDFSDADESFKKFDDGTVTKYSLSTWTPETQERVKKDLVKAGYSAEKVDAWIKDTNGVAATIAADKDRLDFTAADNQVMLKDNQEYIKTLDASTLCAKRLIYQGTFDAIQHRLPNQMLSSDELIDLLNMMKKHKVQTPCGVCYVESRRRHLGKFAQEWLNGYNGAYKPNLDEVTTSDGLEKLRKTHPDTYKDFVDAMNKKGSSNPKVVQLRTEYRNEIMSLTPSQINKIEAIGGLRVQSFSDFETPHMLDMMQAVMDMSAKKLHSQAYTKVPNFAWIFGDTGIKINLSLIAEGDGFDADGRLAFSSTEGMDFDEAMLLRDAYSANVGTIIVGANDKHILACMADDRIDFIIPFHRSGWGSKELHLMGMDSYTDYTYGQKEHDLATGKGLANLYPPDYWDYNLTGKENAERYLKLCAQTGREPKFSKFLVDNGDGSYSLQPDGSTDGYWKTLIDFKMYDNNGVGAPQQVVQPNFNMDQAYRVLDEYEGGANELPVANDVVEEFVSKYRAKNIAPTKYSISDTAYNAAVASNDTITLQNMVDDAASAAGYQRLFYHGTPNGDFTKFKGGNPMWITESRDYAETYAKNKSYNEEDERVMELYAKMDNILDITKIDTAAPLYNGKYASKELVNLAKAIGVETSVLSRMAGGTPYTQVWELVNTKKFADLARKQGYDTIKENEFGNITYGVLDPTQLKSAELVTRKHGKVIPLSERFNEKKKDIRYSLSNPETDKTYLDAVARGDTGTAQMMVDEAAKEAGYTERLHHGTPRFGFTKIETAGLEEGVDWSPFFATDSLEVASTYSGSDNVKKVSEASTKDDADRERVLKDIHSDSIDFAEYCNSTLGIRGWVDYDYISTKVDDILEELEHSNDHSAARDEFYGFCDELFYSFVDNYYYGIYDEKIYSREAFEESQEYEKLADDFYAHVDDIISKFALLDYDAQMGIYDLYANTDGLFEIDAQGNSWNRIPFDSSSGSYLVNTRRLATYARNQGYNGVKITNVFDDGGRGRSHQIKPATVYIFFDPKSQIKSADPVTYDDDGNVIPLSERFKSDNNDIRFSLSPETSQGVDRIALENIAPTREQIAEMKRATTPAKKVDTLPTRKEVAPIKEMPKKAEPKVAKVLTEESGGKKKGFDAWAAAKNLVLDKGMVFEDLALKTKNRTLQARWNSIRYANSKAQKMIGNGYGKAKALTSIRSEVESSGKTEEFYNYLYHKHNVDRMSLETNKTARSLGMKNKPVFGDDVTAKDSARIVAEYEKSNPEFKAWAKDVYDYMNTLREMLVTDGVISRETANLWAELYPSYVPVRRAGKEGLAVNVPLDTRRTGVNAPIKSAKGGNSNIEPLFGTMALRTEQTYRAIARNRFGIELRKTLGSELESSAQGVDETIDSIDDNDSLLKEGKNGRLPTFTVFENGKKVTFEITDEMYNAMKPTSEVLRYRNKVLNMATSIFRSLVTEYNPIFMIKNPIKDTQDVLINSQHPAKTYAAIPKAVTEVVKNGEYYREYLANGGEQNTYFESDSKTFTKENEGFKKWIGMPFRAISWANGIIERIPRLAEYIASREAGRDIDVSMLDAARVTTNFAAGGDLTKALNRNGFTFLNASVQGAMQNVRNVREAKANGLKGWVQLAAKVTAAGLPALLLNALVWDDDEEYEELSDYVKQNYYIIAKFGDGTFVRIPKGRTVAVIQDAFEQMKNLVTGDDEVDMQTFFELVVSNLAPNNPLENNVIAPIQQALTNKTWYGDDLVPTRLQDLPAAEQYDESIDVISKWLGETTNTSPYKWNYVLDQYSGVIGDIVLPMLTPASDGGGLRAPFADAFTTDSTMKNQNISDFYDTVDELNTKAKGKNATDADVLRYKFISSANSELSDLYKAKRFIQNSNMTDEEKDDAVRKLQRVIDDLAKESLDSYKNVRIDGNRAAVGDKQYKYEKGEWKKITDDKREKRDRVINYLNTLDVDYGEKLIIYRSIYKNDNAYNKEIVEYVRNRNDLTYDEMVAIFESLGFTVKNGRVYWN